MMKTTIKFEGMNEVLKELQRKGKRVGDAMAPAAEEGADVILDAYKSNLRGHRNTGHFEETAKRKIDGKGKNFVVAHIGGLDDDKDTAIGRNTLEYGHKTKGDEKTEAVPAMRNALKKTKRKVNEVFRRRVETVIGN